MSARLLRALVPGLPLLWLGLFFLVPFAITLKISLSDPVLAQPPYLPILDWEAGLTGWREFFERLDFANYALVAEDDLYWRAALSSVRVAGTATGVLALLGLPFALAMARAPRGLQPVLVALVVVPFWTSFLIRVYAWTAILRPDGLLDRALALLGLPPQGLLNSEAAVLIGLVYTYLPFMVLPLYAVLERQDPSLVEAARDLGARPLTAFLTVTLPLAAPGLGAGALLCFVPMVGEFVVPDLLGGSDTLMIGRVLWSEFFSNRDWPLAATVAILLLAIVLGPLVLFREAAARRLERLP